MSRYADIEAVERKVKDDINTTEVRVDMGGGDVATAEHIADVGDDSCPIPGIDLAVVEDVTGEGNQVVTGYAEPQHAPKTAPGEKRIYCRDETGTLLCEIWLKREEMVIEAFASGYPIRIVTDGAVVLDSPDVRLGSEAGRQVACVGDLVAVVLPPMVAGPFPVAPVPSTAVTLAGGVLGSGQIISGRSTVKAGP